MANKQGSRLFTESRPSISNSDYRTPYPYPVISPSSVLRTTVRSGTRSRSSGLTTRPRCLNQSVLADFDDRKKNYRICSKLGSLLKSVSHHIWEEIVEHFKTSYSTSLHQRSEVPATVFQVLISTTGKFCFNHNSFSTCALPTLSFKLASASASINFAATPTWPCIDAKWSGDHSTFRNDRKATNQNTVLKIYSSWILTLHRSTYRWEHTEATQTLLRNHSRERTSMQVDV